MVHRVSTAALERLAAAIKEVLERNRDTLPIRDVLQLQTALEILEELLSRDGPLSRQELESRVSEVFLWLLRFSSAAKEFVDLL